MFGHVHIFVSFIVVCTHLKCYTTSVCSFHYVCSRWTIGYVQDMVVCFWTQFINFNKVPFPWTLTMNNKIVNLSIGNWFYINNLKMKIGGCNHNPTSQMDVGPQKKNQNWIIIYVLPFKAMAIMTNYCFFIHMNVKEFKFKFYLMKFINIYYNKLPKKLFQNSFRFIPKFVFFKMTYNPFLK
jgi:hypothetical protein